MLDKPWWTSKTLVTCGGGAFSPPCPVSRVVGGSGVVGGRGVHAAFLGSDTLGFKFHSAP